MRKNKIIESHLVI